MTARVDEVRALQRQLAEQDEEITRLRRLILDAARTGPGLAALVEAGGTGESPQTVPPISQSGLPSKPP